MASISKKKIGKNIYHYAVTSERVDGKPRITSQVYLGKAEDIVEKVTNPPKPEAVKSSEFGSIAALMEIAEQLKFVELVDDIVPKRNQGASVGQYLLIAALNRCSSPTSKARMAEWYEGTILPRLMGVDPKVLTSQRFWDNMDMITEEDLAQLKLAFSRQLVETYRPQLDVLLYDATNFFTYIHTTTPSKLPQRGHNKQKRNDLRQIGLALLMAREGLPLAYEAYQGNRRDTTEFDAFITSFIDRYMSVLKGCEEITLVFDKGNNSKDNMKKLDQSPFHFIGSLVPSYNKDLLAVPLTEYKECSEERLQDERYYRTKKKVFGKERTIVCVFNPELYTGQLRGIHRNIEKTQKELKNLKKDLDERKTEKKPGRQPTEKSVIKRIKKILSREYMSELFTFNVEDTGQWIELDYNLDNETFQRFKDTRLGKTILFTDRDDMKSSEVILAYRDQWRLENAFRQMKDPSWVSFKPLGHWTDQKIRVHAFYCFASLVFSSLLVRNVKGLGIHISISRILEHLKSMRESTIYYPKKRGKSERPKVTMLEDMTKEQEELFAALGLEKYAVR